MLGKEKVLVYPYDYEFTPVLRHIGLLHGLNVTILVSPGGWGLSGKDAAYSDGGIPLGITVRSDFDESLDECDTVWFVTPGYPCDCFKLT